jgi:ElaB/YqjD/DUF883 family membrane-anchored ribosome-binding protein
MAEEAIEDGLHATKRAMKAARRQVEALGDFKEQAISRVKREPVKSVGMAVGPGLLIGVAVGFACGWVGRKARESW